MKRIVLWILLLFPIVLFAQTNGTIHVILFSATHDSKVGTSCEETNKYFKEIFVPKLRNNTGCNVITYFFSGVDFSINKLNTTIISINTSNNDVIFFYYAGHGYNRGYNNYPTLTFGIEGEELSSRQRDVLDIYNSLKQKPHRLLIVMSEACNQVYQTRHDIQSGRILSSYHVDEDTKNHYQELFCDAYGEYLMSSSMKGEYSYLATGRAGFFTCAFQDVFSEITSKSYNGIATWNTLLSNTKSKTTHYARENGKTQNPQWIKGAYSSQSTSVVTPSQPPTQTTTKLTIGQEYSVSTPTGTSYGRIAYLDATGQHGLLLCYKSTQKSRRNVCSAWRSPTKGELLLIYQNRYALGLLDEYWSSDVAKKVGNWVFYYTVDFSNGSIKKQDGYEQNAYALCVKEF